MLQASFFAANESCSSDVCNDPIPMMCMICTVLGRMEEKFETDKAKQTQLDDVRKTMEFLAPRIAALHVVCEPDATSINNVILPRESDSRRGPTR